MFDVLRMDLAEAAENVRKIFDTYNVPHMTLKIEVSGRTHGDLKIEYDVCSQYDASVKGADLAAVLDEYIRQREWKTRNAAVALPAPSYMAKSNKKDDDMPF